MLTKCKLIIMCCMLLTWVSSEAVNEDWWKHAVFYQIYPKSFKDSNGDGKGDLQGIISKLHYLKDLGITAVCLAPIYTSPQVDQGYDISDFKNIDQIYGTLRDFEEMVYKAHQLGLKIIVDFVPNHSSNQHEWFKKSENNESGFENFYIWKNGNGNKPPNNWLSIFSGPAWTYSEKRGQWYLHQFSPEQPDLNYRNPEVVKNMKNVLTFWLYKGVDGFRMAAVPYLFENQAFIDEPTLNDVSIDTDDHASLKHLYTSDQGETFDMIYQWRALLDMYSNIWGCDARIMITEAYTDIENTMLYYGSEERQGAHFTLNFQFITKLNETSTARDIISCVQEWLRYMPLNYTANWMIGNHDNHRVATRFGPERVDGMNMLVAFLPGIMVTYNAEEIGQEDGEVEFSECQDTSACYRTEEYFYAFSRDFERTPYHWDNSKNAGFTNGTPWLPVSKKCVETNLALQSNGGAQSRYHIYQEILRLRQEPAFKNGGIALKALSDNILAFSRSYGNDVFVVVINTAVNEEIVDLSIFNGVNKYIKIMIATPGSSKRNRVLLAKKLVVSGYESIVALILPEYPEGSSDWWKNAVLYQIYPRSFKDLNNDGVGDLAGIIQKLDHLRDAGVTATWLSPIYTSPQVDQGYDISDFLNIDKQYGSLEEFRVLILKAHILGIKVIMDFVPNHSSNEHEWFKKSEKREAGYEDYYVWKDGIGPDKMNPPNNWLSNFKNSAWTYSETRKQFYLHQFAEAQPDLNYRNPLVVEEMDNVLKVWLDRGVDGFRMNAVVCLFEDEEFKNEPLSNIPNVLPHDYEYLNHIYTRDLPETFQMIYHWRTFLDDYSKEHGGDDRIIITEAYSDIGKTMLYYGDDTMEGAHFTFNFQFITKLTNNSNAHQIVQITKEWLENIPNKHTSNWVLGNHDNHRVATRFGTERVDGMNMLIALLPGVMVTYNGEEIGQENGEVSWEEGKDPSARNVTREEFEKVSRDFERTPFHWDGSKNAGFNSGAKPWLPISGKYTTNNLAAQKSNPQSHYIVYKNLIKLRKELAFRNGLTTITAITNNVFAFTREILDGFSYVIVSNIANQEEKVDLSRLRAIKTTVEVVATNVNSDKLNRAFPANQIVLSGYESIVAKILPDPDWWKHAVFYQIYLRSFMDSNNDGIGDLQGIISKLNHLSDAGVTAACLSPIYKSPQVDQGYDISDFMAIHGEYGTLDDFDKLIEEAHKLHIKIIINFVPNHSSIKHEWFNKSENREEGYEDFYVWRNGIGHQPPSNWLSLLKNSAWTYSNKRGQWYLHQFTPQQPDLNYLNPNVRRNMTEILKFWLDRGVDGFRMDAVSYLVEHNEFKNEPLSSKPNALENDYEYLKHIYTSDQEETYDVIYEWREFVDKYNQNNKNSDPRILMAEAYTDIEHTMLYYGDGLRNGTHFAFNFLFIEELYKTSTADDFVFVINKWSNALPDGYTSNWVLGNHNNHRVATRFGPERVDGMNIIAAVLPGIIVTYNGEEIGQENGEVRYDQCQDPTGCKAGEANFAKVSRDFERTPFHWDSTTNAGFNVGKQPWLPVSAKYKTNNLAAQSIPGVSSHYHVYQQLLTLRKDVAFVNGIFGISVHSKNVLVIVRGNSYVAVVNMGSKTEKVDLGIGKYVKVVIANENSKKHARVYPSNAIELTPYESIVAKILPDAPKGKNDWWKRGVFYQIYPRSFKDDNNDGIGDLQGIISKLNHIKDAGIAAVWLSPIYKSPQVDQGYDISDFINIDEDYGTLDEFDTLIKKAHNLGIKIIMDFVPNHSSNKHEWFLKSEKREKGYEDFYIWRDGKNNGTPNNWLSIFKYSAWEYSEIRKQYYLHQFAVAQPDLNYRNPVVVQKMKDVLRVWLDRGVDGFRMDAVPYLFENQEFKDEPLSHIPGISSNDHKYLEHIHTSDQQETFDMIYQWRTLLDDYTLEHGGDARIMMTEAYTDINNTMLYYGNGINEGAHFTFNFQLITKLSKNSKAADIVLVIKEWLNHMPSKYTSNWVLGNHDNSRVATKFGPKNVDGFNMLIGLLPGIMVTYNGEEIGQENGEVTWDEGKDPSACNAPQQDFDKMSRDFERTPFHWDNSANAGFNKGAKPWLPVSKKYKNINLKAQMDPSSLSHYQIYKKILQLRTDQKTLQYGNLTMDVLSENVLGYTRSLEGSETYIFLFNIGEKSETFNINTLLAETSISLTVILSSSKRNITGENARIRATEITLEAHEGLIAITTAEDPNNAASTEVTLFTLFFALFLVRSLA